MKYLFGHGRVLRRKFVNESELKIDRPKIRRKEELKSTIEIKVMGIVKQQQQEKQFDNDQYKTFKKTLVLCQINTNIQI